MERVEGRDAQGPEGDSRLMARFYACSETAFDTLSERWWPRLFAFFRKLGFSNEDAEDLVMDSLVKLYATKERQSFDTSQQLAPFLFTIARNLAIAFWRRQLGPSIVPLNDCVHLPSQEEKPDPDLVSDLLDCVWKLPETELTYVALCGRHGLGELSHGEIAQMLGKWAPQITLISKRALSTLRHCMTLKGYR